MWPGAATLRRSESRWKSAIHARCWLRLRGGLFQQPVPHAPDRQDGLAPCGERLCRLRTRLIRQSSAVAQCDLSGKLGRQARWRPLHSFLLRRSQWATTPSRSTPSSSSQVTRAIRARRALTARSAAPRRPSTRCGRIRGGANRKSTAADAELLWSRDEAWRCERLFRAAPRK